MRNLFLAETCKETQLHVFNPQSWLQVERGKVSNVSSHSPSSIESLIKVAEPPVLPFFKPIDYVEVLAQIHEELECCLPHEKSELYLQQFQVFRGLGEVKLPQSSLRSALEKATTVYEKLIFAAWLKYEKKEEEPISDLLSSCRKCSQEFSILDVASEIPIQASELMNNSLSGEIEKSSTVFFRVREEYIACDRQKIANLSHPFQTMLQGCFTESIQEVIDMSENSISPIGMRAISDFSLFGSLNDSLSVDILLEILVFANTFCCERLKVTCDRKLASLVSSKQDAVELMECALEENSPVLAASCLQFFLQNLADCLQDEQVIRIFSTANRQQRSIMVGHASFSLYCFLSEVAMNANPISDVAASFVEKLVECAVSSRQRQLAFHQLGCVRLLRKEYDEAESLFGSAVAAGHIYSVAGLARIACFKSDKHLSYEMLSTVISSYNPLGWMYLERSLYTEGEKKWENLDKATELDPTLLYPYMFRASYLMKQQNVDAALVEINRVLGFKLALECLELRFCLYLALEDYRSALCDVQTILTLSPDYRMFEGRVASVLLQILVQEHVEQCTIADCWLQLYERWSTVDDIGSLSVIYQMLEMPYAAKGVLYFRQSLLLLRLNCPEAAMRSLQLAREHATSLHDRLVYEGWILYDTGHREEGLRKADESISIQRSFEAFFLKAYAMADSSTDPLCSTTVISLLEDALRCPSDRLRKGQALNNLGSVYVDCGNLDLAADCYMTALRIQHTRAHQGLARVHFLQNNRNSAYEEMTKFIEKARHNASAYEKRSEYCDRELTKADLQMVTKLDPLRVYPYRYRAAVLMDTQHEEEAIAELSRAIAFKADLHLLHLRAAFHEHIGNMAGALRDCRAALSVDPNHQEMLELHSRVNSQEP
ncbi:ETO1-like protein 1 [Dendrobium catenatum]|uniref:ETO1-like protein 1 n=1 Tax=Dendrobium catenatum TaxID=906689 RepID=A0A2I0XCC0_9ASPA|nr:ETO1-like protein 1 [Dendrobium catenatum]PKU85550.1 ETO1-like protein 1 [Dendrobium catenatum]